jgi:DNA-binding transcriptional ArsR family regulator
MSDIFDAIADPTRRQILESLAAKPKQSVSDLVALTKQGQPTVSKHLKTLRDAGLVSVATVGPNRFYSIVEKPLLDVAKWLGKVGVARLEQVANAKSGAKTSSAKTSTTEDLSPVAVLIGDMVAYGLDMAGKKIGERVNIEVDGKKLGREVGRKLADAKSTGQKAAKKAVDKGSKAAKDATEQAMAAAREAVENAAAEIRHRSRRKAD